MAARLHDLASRDERIRVLGHVDDRSEFFHLLGAARAYLHGHSVGGMNPSLGTERKDVKYALPVLQRFVASRPGIGSDIRKPGATELAYRRTPLRAMYSLSQLWPLVAADLAALRAPVLLFRSRVDHVVEPMSGRLLVAGASSTEVTEVILEESYHVATLDHDAPAIFAGSLDFVRAHTTTPAAG